MDGVFVHSTSVLMAILRSGQLLGRHKMLQGEELDRAIREGAVRDSDCETFFVQWQHDSMAHSLSRLGARKPDDIRAVLVFKDPKGRMEKEGEGAYPCVAGRNVPLDTLSLRAVIVVEEDLNACGVTYQEISRLIDQCGAKGAIFAFYWTDADGIRDEWTIDAKLKEATAHGCLG